MTERQRLKKEATLMVNRLQQGLRNDIQALERVAQALEDGEGPVNPFDAINDVLAIFHNRHSDYTTEVRNLVNRLGSASVAKEL